MTERLTATVSVKVPADPADGYAEFEALVRTHVAAVDGPLFTTNADPDALWAAYLENLPADRRQHYNCHTCRRFVQRYGGLVRIDNGIAFPKGGGRLPVRVRVAGGLATYVVDRWE